MESTKDFFIETHYSPIVLFSQKDKILQWVLGHVTKIWKDLNNFMFPYMIYSQNMAKSSYG